MINTIQSKIIDELKEIKGLRGVYSAPPATKEGYPYIYVVFRANTSSILTNREDLVDIEFTVHLLQEKIEELKGRAEAERTTNDRVWKIEEALRKNNSLGLSEVIRTIPLDTRKVYTDNGGRINTETTVKVQVISDVEN